MSKFIIVLTNASYGVTVGTVAVCGNSGKRYGHSTYSDKWRCHAIEMTLPEYEVACDDLARGWHKALCKWVPHFVEVQETVVTAQNNEALRETAIRWASQLSAEDIKQIAAEKHLIIMAVPIEGLSLSETVHFVKEGIEWNLSDKSVPDQPLGAIATRFLTNAAANAVASGEFPTKYLSLCKMARDEGIDISALPRTGEAVRAAILAHRQQKAA